MDPNQIIHSLYINNISLKFKDFNVTLTIIRLIPLEYEKQIMFLLMYLQVTV